MDETNKKKSTNKTTTAKSPMVEMDGVKLDTSSLSETELTKLVLELQKQIKDLTTLSGCVNSADSIPQKASDNENNIPLTSDDDIAIVNLCNGNFSLSTESFGNGKQYEFNGFGYQRDIPYNELKECIHSNLSFFESGRVYILDERVIKKFRLGEFYKNMLDEKGIRNLKNLSPKDLYKKLTNLPKATSTILNRNNEPTQFDIVYSHLLEGVKQEEFSIEQIAQIQKVYKIYTGRSIDIEDELEFAEYARNNSAE